MRGFCCVAPWEMIAWLLIVALQTQSADYFGVECGFFGCTLHGYAVSDTRTDACVLSISVEQLCMKLNEAQTV